MYLPYRDEYNLKFQRFFRIEDFNPVENWSNIWGVLLPNTNLLAKVAYVNDFDPLLAGRYANLINYLDGQQPENRTGFLKLLNVGAVESIDPSTPAGVQFSAIDGTGRFQWDGCALPAKNEDESWKLTVDLANHPKQGVVVVEGIDSAESCSAEGEAAIQINKETPQSVSVTIDAEKSGWLLMADTWYPGWVATVDGSPVNIYKADYLLRAIPVESGQHDVEFYYQPESFMIGLAITAVGWAIILLFILIHAIRNSFRNKL